MVTPKLAPETRQPLKWPPERDMELCDLVAEDRYSFSEIGAMLGVSKGSAMGRFDRLRLKYGHQGQ